MFSHKWPLNIIFPVLWLTTALCFCSCLSKWDLTFSWMALRFDGCTKTLYPIWVSSLTCFGARGALLSHALNSSLLIASTDLRWCQHLVWWNTHLPFVCLKARSMVKPDGSKDKVIKQYRCMYDSDIVCAKVLVSFSICCKTQNRYFIL